MRYTVVVKLCIVLQNSFSHERSSSSLRKPLQQREASLSLHRGVEVFDDFMDEHEQKAKEDRRKQRKEYVEKVKD